MGGSKKENLNRRWVRFGERESQEVNRGQIAKNSIASVELVQGALRILKILYVVKKFSRNMEKPF